MSERKFGLTMVHILAFQLALACSASLTMLHALIVLILTGVYLTFSAASFYLIDDEDSLAMWDYSFHVIISPLLLGLPICYFNGRDRTNSNRFLKENLKSVAHNHQSPLIKELKMQKANQIPQVLQNLS